MKFIVGISCAALATCIAGGAQTGTARAQSIAGPNSAGSYKYASEADAAATLRYWTPERLKSAQPKLLTTTRTFSPGAATAAPNGPTNIVPGALPTIPYDGSLAEQLYVSPNVPNNQIRVKPLAVGSGNYPYTINRLYPTLKFGKTTNTSNIYTFYPYAIVGQLYFTEPSGNFVCSASVIRLSVIATAGHCVSSGNGDFYSNWLFIPAWHANIAPYGRWTWSYVDVTGPWFHGGGGVPNSQDDALIALNTNGGRKIGQVTGYIGYEYGTPLPTHITQLGYPCNLDGCSDPIQDNSQDYSGPNHNFEWGTYAFGGASGGPEIQDFGQALSGGPSEAFGGNILISSTSYDYTKPPATTVQVDGGSMLDGPSTGTLVSFTDLINDMCARGYC